MPFLWYCFHGKLHWIYAYEHVSEFPTPSSRESRLDHVIFQERSNFRRCCRPLRQRYSGICCRCCRFVKHDICSTLSCLHFLVDVHFPFCLCHLLVEMEARRIFSEVSSITGYSAYYSPRILRFSTLCGETKSRVTVVFDLLLRCESPYSMYLLVSLSAHLALLSGGFNSKVSEWHMATNYWPL